MGKSKFPFYESGQDSRGARARAFMEAAVFCLVSFLLGAVYTIVFNYAALFLAEPATQKLAAQTKLSLQLECTFGN